MLHACSNQLFTTAKRSRLLKMAIAEKLAQEDGQQVLLYKQGLFCTACCKKSHLQLALAAI